MGQLVMSALPAPAHLQEAWSFNPEPENHSLFIKSSYTHHINPLFYIEFRITFNQWVAGSNPARLTTFSNENKDLGAFGRLLCLERKVIKCYKTFWRRFNGLKEGLRLRCP